MVLYQLAFVGSAGPAAHRSRACLHTSCCARRSRCSAALCSALLLRCLASVCACACALLVCAVSPYIVVVVGDGWVASALGATFAPFRRGAFGCAAREVDATGDAKPSALSGVPWVSPGLLNVVTGPNGLPVCAATTTFVAKRGAKTSMGARDDEDDNDMSTSLLSSIPRPSRARSGEDQRLRERVRGEGCTRRPRATERVARKQQSQVFARALCSRGLT